MTRSADLPNTPQEDAAVLVADLDKILTDTVAFRLHGVTRYIKPVSAETFFRYAESIARLGQLRRENLADQTKFAKALYEITRHVVDPITYEDIERCSLAQQAGLYSTVLDCVSGRQSAAPNGNEKKKLTTPAPVTCG
jgi:hypothetical protein